MDSFEELFKQIISSVKTSDERESSIRILDEFIKQIDKAEGEFNNLKDLFSLVLEALPNPIWVIEQNGEYFYYNSYAKKIDGILQVCPSEFSECEILFDKEYYLMQKSKKNDKILITATNITNEKQKERLASMGQISAHLAHEIRNPIGAISLMISSLLKKDISPSIKVYILEMTKAIWRVERLINATLMFSKGDVRAITQRFSSSIIEESIKDCIAYFEYSKHIDFIFNINSENITCDRELLELLLQNLILNAIEAIEDSESISSGEIRVEFSVEDEVQLLKIYDNGDEASDIENLFEAFKSTKVKGNGLGLALCKQIAKAHGGDIAYYKSPNKHFLVTFRI